MIDKEKHERCVCRVAVDAEKLLKGFELPPGTQIVRIIPITDRLEFFEDHWLFLRHESLPEIPKGRQVPRREIIIEDEKRDLGDSVTLTRHIVRFSEELSF